MQNSFDHSGCGLTGNQRKCLNFASPSFDFLLSDDVGGPVGTFDKYIRVNRQDGFQRSVFVKSTNVIHHLESFEDFSPFGLREDWPVGPLQSADRVVAIDRNNQRVAKLACAVEQIQVSGVNDVETTIGKDNTLSCLLQPAYILSNGVSGLDGNHV